MENERKLRDFLMKIGCRVTLKGFRYLMETIKVASEDDTAIFNLTTNVYPKVAKKFNATSDNIVRDIHTVIINAWSNDAEAIQDLYFSKSKYAPTVKEFIGVLVSHLKFAT